MLNRTRRFSLTWVVVGILAVYPAVHAQPAGTPNPEQLAQLEQLKTDAFKALKSGDFDKTDQLLKSAASISNDPSLSRMSTWLEQYRSQRQTIASERRKKYDKAVAETQKLIDAKLDDFAIDKAKDAALDADDKAAFCKLPWMQELIKRVVDQAAKAEAEEQWLRASRLYADLNLTDSENPKWKEKLTACVRHWRLIGLYAPERAKTMREADKVSFDAANHLLDPAATQPATRAAIDDNDAFKTDWHDVVRGARIDMVREALDDAHKNYWKPITYRTLLNGGLKSLTALATTGAIHETFPGLKDELKRDQFLVVIGQARDEMNQNPENEDNDLYLLRRTISNLVAINKQTLELPEEVIATEFADGAFAELDPFTSVIWPSDVDDFNKTTQGEFIGVGIQIINDDEMNLKVVSPLEDTPAYRAGLAAGDIITHINGKIAKGITTNQAVKVITGPSNTMVNLTVRSLDGTVKDYTLKRELIRVGSVKGYKHLPGGGWDYMIDPEQKIGYVRLTNFQKTSDEELNGAIKALKTSGARAMILDLRGNPGGLLTSATEISDRFLHDGTIVSTRANREDAQSPQQVVEARPSADDCQLPLVVLVNQFSASASEIVSGALKDQKRAILVGERTFGKGSVQMLFGLPRREAYLKLTTSHYYLPSGRCIHKEEDSKEWGVDPDVKVEITPEQAVEAAEARRDLDVLRLHDVVEPAPGPSTRAVHKPLLDADSQLAAALLVLRLQLAGASL